MYVNLRFLTKVSFKIKDVVKPTPSTEVTSKIISSANSADEAATGSYSTFGRTDKRRT